MKYTLEYRFGRNDQWSTVSFDLVDKLKDELVYKAFQGCEVRLDEATNAMDLNDL